MFTASGGMADIVAHDNTTESYIEVSLIRDRTQTTNEMIPIARHLRRYIADSDNTRNKFSVFVAPAIHSDAQEYADFVKHRDNLDVVCYDIDDFIAKANGAANISEFIG